jgi:hypothetical protein
MYNAKTMYPTAEEILNPPVDYKISTIRAVLEWKKQFFKSWREKSNEEKLTALEILVAMLGKVYETSVSVNKYGTEFRYMQASATIEFDKEKPSIISTLHEFRHAINGGDEKSACRWSVQLFAKCFPTAFSNLQFKNGSHLLVKKE